MRWSDGSDLLPGQCSRMASSELADEEVNPGFPAGGVSTPGSVFLTAATRNIT